jgi:hypothetical protein
MARIFTTRFEFNQKDYDAIVTVISQGNKVSFKIRILDRELQRILPDGEVEYTGLNGFENLVSMDNTLAQSLMRSISRAIDSHLAHKL